MTDTLNQVPTPSLPPTQSPDQQLPTPEPIVAPPLPFTANANLTEYRRRLGVWRIILAFALTFFFFYKLGFVGWLLSVVAITAILITILMFFKKRSITLTETGIEYRRLLAKPRLISYEEIESVKVFLYFYEASFGTAPKAVFGLKSKQSPISLYALYWSPEDIDKILAILKDKKVLVEYYEDIATYTVIAQQFPSYATYIEKHPVKIAVFATIGIIVAITLGIIIFQSLDL